MSEQREVESVVERMLRGSRCIEKESLCVVRGKQVWSVRVDLRVVQCDGNLRDCCALAAVAALHHYRRLDVTFSGGKAVVHGDVERAPVPLTLHHVPILVTFCLYKQPEDCGGGVFYMTDPTREEELMAAGLASVATNKQDELCGIYDFGGVAVDPLLLQELIQESLRHSKEWIELMTGALEADAKIRELQRKNVYSWYSDVKES
eukprot:GHVU01057953.1.p2 GENE.GHVU01057953.1~~GHVU01057953.1.p2  ORF type:complete len:205 (-),score=37.51 GHVU01057953.1:132-746(-)